MATYDPQRSRSRHRVGDADGPAPVDAILGSVTSPAPEGRARPAETDAPSPPDATDATEAADDGVEPAPIERALTKSREPLVVDLDAPAPAGNGRSRGAAARAVLVAALVAMVAALALWWRRRRTDD